MQPRQAPRKSSSLRKAIQCGKKTPWPHRECMRLPLPYEWNIPTQAAAAVLASFILNLSSFWWQGFSEHLRQALAKSERCRGDRLLNFGVALVVFRPLDWLTCSAFTWLSFEQLLISPHTPQHPLNHVLSKSMTVTYGKAPESQEPTSDFTQGSHRWPWGKDLRSWMQKSIPYTYTT